MALEEFAALRDGILAEFAEFAAGGPRSAAALAAARERLENARLTVAFTGEFKSGKSSLINALLGEVDPPRLLPEAEEIATGVVTAVSHADPERVTVVLRAADGTAGERLTVSRAELPRYVTETGNPEGVRDVLLVSVGTPSPLLAPGLQLVDTPGTGGPHLRHSADAMAFLPSAHAVVCVLDSGQALLAGHVRAVRQAAEAVEATGSRGALLFALTKTDTGGYGEVLTDAVAKIATALDRPAEDVVVVPVSARAHRDYLAYGEPEDLELGNVPALERALETALAARGIPAVLGDALRALREGLDARLGPLRAERRALGDATAEAGRASREAAERRGRRLDELRGKRAAWRGDLHERATALQAELAAYGEDRLAAVWDHCEASYLYDPAYLYAPDKLVERLTADAALVVGSVNERARDAAARMLEDFTRTSGLDLGTASLAEQQGPPPPEAEVTGTLGQELRGSPLKRKLRDLSFGGGIGSTVGGFLGSLVLPGLGTAIGVAAGGLVGMAAGWDSAGRDVRNEDIKQRRQSLATELKPVRREQRGHVLRAARDIGQEFGAWAEAELDRRIAVERETNERLIEGLSRVRRLTEEQAAARIAELDAELAPLVRREARFATLAARAERLAATGRATPPPPPGEPGADDISWAEQ
ncbi:dynamin family protein [Streptomyces sp. URMC 129]|uniref:dynamin family protein n=1 Tax=Streptomyces sp. URMC 129 TaxID=3423407 RepID=UPI003F1DA0F1